MLSGSRLIRPRVLWPQDEEDNAKEADEATTAADDTSLRGGMSFGRYVWLCLSTLS